MRVYVDNNMIFVIVYVNFRVSFGSSKGSMVETLVYETPVQEEPENNHFHDHCNGRLSAPITFGSPLLLAPETE